MDLIQEFENVLDKATCTGLIAAFEAASERQQPGHTVQGYDPAHKLDTEIRVDSALFALPEWAPLLTSVLAGLKTSIETYKSQSLGLELIAPWMLLSAFNFQRYLPGEGYPTLHCEVGGMDSTENRVLTWILYLNDVTDCGETYFPNQQRRLSARQGKLVVAPAYWTHCHKGIISPTQTKYILTGWYGFC